MTNEEFLKRVSVINEALWPEKREMFSELLESMVEMLADKAATTERMALNTDLVLQGYEYVCNNLDEAVYLGDDD